VFEEGFAKEFFFSFSLLSRSNVGIEVSSGFYVLVSVLLILCFGGIKLGFFVFIEFAVKGFL
jgi:hypothetical protein